MSDSNEYTPPRGWHWDSESGGRFAKINRPTAGAQFDVILDDHGTRLRDLLVPSAVGGRVNHGVYKDPGALTSELALKGNSGPPIQDPNP